MRGRVSRRSILAATGAAAVALRFGEVAQAKAAPLRFLNWETYIGETTLEDFQRSSGVPVAMEFFSSNEALLSRVRGGASYDVVVPSSDYVRQMISEGLLSELDHARLPNLANVSPDFRDPPYDPGCRHSVPYSWLVLGIGYRKSAMAGGVAPDSWKAVFESDQHAGRIGWMSEPGDMIGLAAKYLGHAVDDRSPETLAAVERLLKAQRPRVVFHQDEGQDMLRNGDIDLVIEYNGDMAIRIGEDPDLGFVVPREGSQIFSDNWVIPKSARQVAAAHAFLNFMLSASAGAEIARTVQYPTPNVAARALMPASYRENAAIFPPEERMAACAFTQLPDAETRAAVEAVFARVLAE